MGIVQNSWLCDEFLTPVKPFVKGTWCIGPATLPPIGGTHRQKKKSALATFPYFLFFFLGPLRVPAKGEGTNLGSVRVRGFGVRNDDGDGIGME